MSARRKGGLRCVEGCWGRCDLAGPDEGLIPAFCRILCYDCAVSPKEYPMPMPTIRRHPDPFIVLDEDDPHYTAGNCRVATFVEPGCALLGYGDQYDPCGNPADDTRFCAEHRAEIGVMDDEDPTEDPHEGDRYDIRGNR